MFDGFARQWTPVLPLARIGNRPQRAVVAGEPLVVWRVDKGRVGVLLDRCPHRSVSLALGSRTPSGGLACSFHGWEFDDAGACEKIPFNPDRRLARRGATKLPHRELGGLLWVFTGFDPDTEPELPDTLLDDSLVRFEHHETWAAHWTRAMENMLDYPHLPYVHRNTIGRFVRAKQRPDSVLHQEVRDTDFGYDVTPWLDDNPPGATLKWYAPNSMVLDTIPAPRLMRIQIYCIPAEPNRVRMLLVTTRNFARNPAASFAFDRFNVKVLHQDRAVVESSDPVIVPERGLETSVPTDKATLTFRTWFNRELPHSSVADPRERTPSTLEG
ncbi:Rieske 2Fe-2S domain-containing protein [Naumannella sp. ID2617S]|nr:Rieske 2Fe-2S domain-containing protein [Naumannella sp. ID2617S]